MPQWPCLARGLLAGVALSFIAEHAIAADTVYRFVEHADTDATHVRGGTGPDNVGDILTFANPVYDAANTHRVGSDQGYCVRVVAGVSYECHWTLSVHGGQIMVDGPFFDKTDSALAITGGTGAFAGASGQMKLHARDAHGGAYDFTYEMRGR